MKIHIVQRGDTLWSIAEKHQVSLEEVKKLNAHLANPEMIVPGMKIKLPDTAMPIEKDHPYANNKPFASPPQMEGLKEMEDEEEPEFTMPENWMTEPVPAPPQMEQDMMMQCPPMPCYFFPVPFPMPHMQPMQHMPNMPHTPYMMPEVEGQEEAEFPNMMPRCPYCHR
ncbi:LysM peptidoglycan-binding domain-containing protein [Domibacillus iocasae]|uniref:LysM domain-containing protein n=1 Tax=Domibacillus iocasae TaxID=1714016 RepID=A0A1E7DMM1_9BACI|nr:LysM domain-containing protein [Domibacillus iocasae]OES44255.1 hypothetical protein BA724_08170 [Domibacillus iocasae]